MKSTLQHWRRLLGCTVLFVTGCAQPSADTAFTVQQIDQVPRGEGAVRIKLTTSGEMAEADANAIVGYVKIVAIRACTRRQHEIAEKRARATFRKMTAGRQGGPRAARYLAVATEKSAPQAGRKSAQSVMIWDTQAQKLVGNEVYDVETAPRMGAVARFEIYSAKYVGAGM